MQILAKHACSVFACSGHGLAIIKHSKRTKLFDQLWNLQEIYFGAHRSLCDLRENQEFYRGLTTIQCAIIERWLPLEVFCVRKLQKHRRIKENLEKSAEEIKSLLRSSLKRGPNVVDEGSSIYFPVIKKPHVDVSTSKPNPNTSSTTPVLGTKTPLTIFPHASTQLTIPVPLHTSTPVKKLKKLSFSKEPTTNSPKPETTVKVNCMRCRDESVVVLIYVFLLKVTWRRLYCLPLRVAGLNYRARLFESRLTKSRISVNFGLLF